MTAKLSNLHNHYSATQRRGNMTQDYYWTPEWQGGEKEADEDIKKGRTKSFNSSADLIVYLKSNSNHDAVVRPTR